MAYIESYTCDQCGTQKKDTNHWWVMSIGLGNAHLMLWDQTNEDFLNGNTALHLCGEACVQKKVSEFMGGKSCATVR